MMLVCSSVIEVSFMKTHEGPRYPYVGSTEVEHNQDMLLTKSKSKEKLKLTGRAKGKTEGALCQEQGTLLLVPICCSLAKALWLIHRHIQIDKKKISSCNVFQKGLLLVFNYKV